MDQSLTRVHAKIIIKALVSPGSSPCITWFEIATIKASTVCAGGVEFQTMYRVVYGKCAEQEIGNPYPY